MHVRGKGGIGEGGEIGRGGEKEVEERRRGRGPGGWICVL